MSNFLFGPVCITSLGKKGTFPAQLCRHLRTLEAEGGGKVVEQASELRTLNKVR